MDDKETIADLQMQLNATTEAERWRVEKLRQALKDVADYLHTKEHSIHLGMLSRISTVLQETDRG